MLVEDPVFSGDKIRTIPFFKDQHPETGIQHLFHKDIKWFYNFFATKNLQLSN
jgi:predicted  nucleic acid-binding Zn ribbon protein